MTTVDVKSPRARPATSPAKPRPTGMLHSIRARLIIVALLAVAPLMVERMRGLERARAERVELARTQVIDLAHGGALAQREVIYSTRAMLQVVAHIQAKTPTDGPDCNRMLAELAQNVPWIYVFGVIGLNGQFTCSADPHAVGLDVSDRDYFRNALEARDFSLSDYLILRLHGLPSVVATYPIIKDDGSLSGVVMASISLKWMGDLAASTAQHPGTSAALIDRNGTVIAASADQAKFVGKTFNESVLVRDALAGDEGTVIAAGFDNAPRIFAFARIPWTQTRLVVGLDESIVHSGIDREITIAYIQLGIFGLLVLLVAWFGGERLILRPIRTLVRKAARLGRGDLQVRASDEQWLAEFEPLAVAFDDMAGKLAERELELQIANEHLEELASLDGLTGLANRRGFDRELDREWRQAMEKRRPLALMMIDIAHFKLFNDRYGHVRGDACLRAVGETLSLITLEDARVVARYGGEEFALLLPGIDLERATALAEEARRAVEDLLITHADAARGVVTISIGVESAIPHARLSPADLVEAADCALYAAKRGGRNAVIAQEPLLRAG
jgi:diguanylate cyclase (GGDEF)-like protein